MKEGVPNIPEQVDKDKNDIQEAVMAIMYIRDQIAVHGHNDSEFEAIKNIVSRLELGDLTPEDAVSEAYALQKFKTGLSLEINL